MAAVPFTGLFDDPPLEVDRQARRDVLSRGIMTGREHLVGYCRRRDERVLEIGGASRRVDFNTSAAALAADSTMAIVVVHNHPGDRPLSKIDLIATATYAGIDGVVALGHGGSCYEAIIESEASVFQQALEMVDSSFRELIQPAVFTGLLCRQTASRFHWHAVASILSSIGIMRYDFVLARAYHTELTLIEPFVRQAIRQPPIPG